MCFPKYANGQTDKQRQTDRHAHCNTPLPNWEQRNHHHQIQKALETKTTGTRDNYSFQEMPLCSRNVNAVAIKSWRATNHNQITTNDCVHEMLTRWLLSLGEQQITIKLQLTKMKALKITHKNSKTALGIFIH